MKWGTTWGEEEEACEWVFPKGACNSLSGHGWHDFEQEYVCVRGKRYALGVLPTYSYPIDRYTKWERAQSAIYHLLGYNAIRESDLLKVLEGDIWNFAKGKIEPAWRSHQGKCDLYILRDVLAFFRRGVCEVCRRNKRLIRPFNYHDIYRSIDIHINGLDYSMSELRRYLPVPQGMLCIKCIKDANRIFYWASSNVTFAKGVESCQEVLVKARKALSSKDPQQEKSLRRELKRLQMLLRPRSMSLQKS